MRRLLFALCVIAVAGLGLTACDPPPVYATQDRRQNQQTGRVQGEVVVTGRARGNVLVFLYDVTRPPPPQGTGRPISFTVVSGDTLFGAARGDPSSGGPFTAPFSFSLVPPGQYYLRGFLDRDGCVPLLDGCHGPDFVPWYGVTSEPNAGDVGGAAIDALTGALRLVTVSAEDEASASSSTGVHVSFGESATVPADRPVFRVAAGSGVLGQEGGTLDLVPEPIVGGPVQQRQPAFFVRYVDENQDGVPDDANADGQPDLWPKVIVRKLSDTAPYLEEENDADGNGVLDEGGKDYPRVDGSLDGLPDRVVLAAGLDPTELYPLLNDDQGQPQMTPVPVNALRVLVRPVALDASNPAAPVRLQGVPKGRYAVFLVQFTGQTWRVPNELQPALGAALGLPAIESQGFTVQVP